MERRCSEREPDFDRRAQGETGLVEADALPPDYAGREDDEDAYGHQHKVDLVEAGTFEESLTEVDRARSACVFCDAPHEVGEDSEADGNHHP